MYQPVLVSLWNAALLNLYAPSSESQAASTYLASPAIPTSRMHLASASTDSSNQLSMPLTVCSPLRVSLIVFKMLPSPKRPDPRGNAIEDLSSI